MSIRINIQFQYSFVALLFYKLVLFICTNLFFNLNKRYGREYADPYLGHGIGPVPGYGVSLICGKIFQKIILLTKKVRYKTEFTTFTSTFFLLFKIQTYQILSSDCK